MLDYAHAGTLRRIVRKTAPTRPMTWLYVRIQRPMDIALFRLSGGRTTLTAWLSGLPVVMLTTTGAKSGQPRTVPVVAMPQGDQLIVIASNFGQARYPAWYHNLRAHPRATVRVDGVTREVDARELSGSERDACFQRAVTLYPGFDIYRERAGRRIPVLVLDPS